VAPFIATIRSVKSIKSDVHFGSGKVIFTFEEVTSIEMSKLWQFGLEEDRDAKTPVERMRGRLERI